MKNNFYYRKGQDMAAEHSYLILAYKAMSMRELEEINDGVNWLFFEAGFNDRDVEIVKAVRYGELPKCGYSINHATGEKEAGISCIGLLKDGQEDIKSLYDITLGWQGVRKYIIEGLYFGKSGSDGEPLLHNCKIIKEIIAE